MLKFENIVKQFGGKTVLAGISHEITNGCIALEGPNGSGKSTLLSILAGAIPTDQGHVWIAGNSLQTESRRAKARLAYVPDECSVYPFITGRQFLELVASAKEVHVGRDVWKFAEGLGLIGHLDARFDAMSLGTQKKMMLVATAIGQPTVIIADEPSNGIDKKSLQLIVTYFRQVAQDGVVIFSTHDRDFASTCNAAIVGMPSPKDPTRLSISIN